MNRTKLAVTQFVGRVITKTVKRTNISSNSPESRPCISQISGNKAPAARTFGEIIHLTTCKIIEVATDRHALKWSHLTEVSEVFGLRATNKDLPVTCKLFL